MRITSKDTLSDDRGTRVVRMNLQAPEIAKKALPGQFVAVMVQPEGERIPLTIVECDAAKGLITIIFQELGFTTKLLGACNVGDELFAVLGPLGRATDIRLYGNIVIIGGGVGIAEIYPVARAFKDTGNTVTAIIGARSKDLIILENELKAVADEVLVATDDGSTGTKGLVTDLLNQQLATNNYQLVYAVGPIPMMRAVCAVTGPLCVKTIVSLNALMVDATGMCGCCRVTVGGTVKFSCVDGPEFDGQSVAWDELTARGSMYHKQEAHICKLMKRSHEA